MGTASQHFNVDVIFLYSTLWEDDDGVISTTPLGPRRPKQTYVDGEDPYYRYMPAFFAGYTDWNRRALSLPTLAKQYDNWTGNFQAAVADLELADTDGAVYSSLYHSGKKPFGEPVAMYVKISENPNYYMEVFNGHITGVSRRRGAVNLTMEDDVANLYNARIVPDYATVATIINGILYGTVKDVIGTNVYLDDYGDVHLIFRQHKDEGGDWWGAFLGAAIGGVIGFFTAGAAPAVGAAIGAGAGFFNGIPSGGGAGYTEYYYQVNDYNAIPDGMVLGGQNLKFYSGWVDGRANHSKGSLYGIPAMKVRGGEFQYGVYGTIEIDDAFHNIKKGDFVYAQVPALYAGSPDTIIVNMLTGSNCSVEYRYPDNFSPDWISQTAALRHAYAVGVITDFDENGVMDAINSLAEEFGFTFYLDESNRFSVRSAFTKSVTGTDVIGTISEDYNVIGEGLTWEESLRVSYTDLQLKYKPMWGGVFEQEINMPLNSATYYGAQKRVKTINCKWIRDGLTGQFMATRLARRYGTITRRVKGQISLYSVPFRLGEIVSVTSAVTGTGKPYEIVSYSKDFNTGITEFEGDDAHVLYGTRAFFTFGTYTGDANQDGHAGFATVKCYPVYYEPMPWGRRTKGAEGINHTQGEIPLYTDAGYPIDTPTYVGSYIRIGAVEEILRVTGIATTYSTRISSNDYTVVSYIVERSSYNTLPTSYVADTFAAIVGGIRVEMPDLKSKEDVLPVYWY